jgi:L-threo-3-deoxy-hexylosonate aldolase
MAQRTLGPGVYAPLPTFFDDNQEIDYVSYKKHLLSMNFFSIKGTCTSR